MEMQLEWLKAQLLYQKELQLLINENYLMARSILYGYEASSNPTKEQIDEYNFYKNQLIEVELKIEASENAIKKCNNL